MEKTQPKINAAYIPVWGYFILIFAVMMMLIGATIPISNHESKSDDSYTDFSTGWLSYDNSEASLSHISGNTIIHRTIQESDCNKTLFFFAKTSNIKVFIDGICQYSNPIFSQQLFGKTPGALFVQVFIPAQSAGKILEIEVENPYMNDDSAKLSDMYLGDITDIIQSEQQNKFPAFCLSFITMVLGIAMLLLFIPLTHQQIIGHELLFLGAVTFISGLFLTTDSRYLQLVYGNAHIYHMIAETAMQLVIPPFLLFFCHMYDKYSKKISTILCFICELTFAGCFICEISGIRDYHQTLILTHIMFAISTIFILISTVKSIIQSPIKNFYHNLGCIMLCVLILTDIIVLWCGIGHETSYFVRLGVLIFVTTEIVQIVKKVLVAYQRNIKNELLSRLAYHDGLTDLLNRTSYMEKVKELENNKVPYILFAIYDVNNLKKVNDTMGHQKGDEMIKRVADVFNASLGKYGQCYRIGGDEFVFISTTPGIEDKFLQENDHLIANFGSISDGDNLVPITVAMGYCVLDGNSSMNVTDIIHEADSLMYEKKRTMKHRTS
jgi:diguanylate cyclase (GGDEF)-like protein